MKTARAILAIISSLLGLLIVLPIAAVAVPFWAVAFLVRRCSNLFAPPSKTWESIIGFDKHVGWKPNPNLDVYCSFAVGAFRVKTDSHGWRGQEDLTGCQALVLGDSFAFGFGVDDENAFFSLTNSGLHVKAIGSPGYNMVQEVIWLDKVSTQLSGKLVVWFICLGNDLYDNLQPNMQNYRTPFVREINGTGTWEIVTTHVRPETWHYNVERDFQKTRDARSLGTFSRTFLSERVYSACEFLIEKATHICRQAGAPLVIVSIPSMSQLDADAWNHWASRIGDPKLFDRDLPDQKLQAICKKFEVMFVPGSKYLSYTDYILEDGHWNEKGHKRIAKLLSSLYQQSVLNSARTDPASHMTGLKPDQAVDLFH